MKTFIVGILIVIAGFLLMWKTEAVYRFTGRVAFAEKYFGTEGGTRLFYKLLGAFTIFIGFLVLTGFFKGFLRGTVGLLIPGSSIQ